MPVYSYKARDSAGKLIRGSMQAESKEDLADKLRKMGYMASMVEEALPSVRVEAVTRFFNRIDTEDMIMFTVQLSNMINAGVSILASVSTLARQTENKYLKETLLSVARNVEAGESFSEALVKYPHVFSRLFVSMVKAGEASGKLDRILTRLAVFTEQQADLKQKIQAALFYPIILLFSGTAVTLFIVTFVVPKFADLFTKAGINLPLPTLILFHAGMAIKQFWYVLPVSTAAAWMAVKTYSKTGRGRLHCDRAKLNVPVYGALYRKVSVSRFARTLGMLLAGGVPILTSLDIIREVMSNEVLARVIDNVRNAVERGEKISESLKISQEFPPDTIQMISVGEETGNLDEMLTKISDFYDLAVGYAVKKLISLIEPLFLCVLGGIVGLIMASMLLPIFDMMKILGGARHN